MSFITKDDLSRLIREYQIDTITDGDDTDVEEAIEAAEEEVVSMFTPTDKKEWLDGRPIYDIDAILLTQGNNRNKLLVRNIATVAIWQLCFICNAGMVDEKVQARYDRAKSYLRDLVSGVVASPTLPRKTIAPPADKLPYRSGSRQKFNHE